MQIRRRFTTMRAMSGKERDWTCEVSAASNARIRRERPQLKGQERLRHAQLNARSSDYSRPWVRDPLSRQRVATINDDSTSSINPRASMIVGRIDPEDIQALGRYLPQASVSASCEPRGQENVTHIASNPVLYLSVPKRRMGFRLEQYPGSSQLEIIEQILGPSKHAVIDL